LWAIALTNEDVIVLVWNWVSWNSGIKGVLEVLDNGATVTDVARRCGMSGQADESI
jgi:hypothetical protein